MRAIIAQRMAASAQTAPHVHIVFRVDMTRIVQLREREKVNFEQRNGVKLTYMPFVAVAAVLTLRKFPIVNASLEGDSIRYHQNINLGIAVALEWGLIVPVIKQAEERNFLGIARSISDLAERARGKRLKPDEISGSTFTLTNSGIFGEEFGTPIINQPDSAILAIGGLEEGSGCPHRRARQRLDCHSLDSALLPWLRPSHYRWRRCGQVHERVQEDAGELESGDRLIAVSGAWRRTGIFEIAPDDSRNTGN